MSSDDQRHQHTDGSTATDASNTTGWSALKGLVGTWKTEATDDMPASTVEFTLTAGGQVLVERLFCDTPMEMVSVYYRDSSGITMTHYCVAGNQPEMRAALHLDNNKLAFHFAGGKNIDFARGMHIHGGSFTFESDGSVQSEWNIWQDGKLDGQHQLKMIRVNVKKARQTSTK